MTEFDRGEDEKSSGEVHAFLGNAPLFNELGAGKDHLGGNPKLDSKVCKPRRPALPGRSRIMPPAFLRELLSNNVQRLGGKLKGAPTGPPESA